MKNATTWLAVAAAAGSLGLAGAVHAKASASAEIRNLRLTLVDLNPSDGIAPSITFADGICYGDAFVVDYVSDLFPYERGDGSGPFAPFVASATTPLGAGNASVTGGGSMNSAAALASGWIAGSRAVRNNEFFAGVVPVRAEFVLTPWTELRFDADVMLSASTSVGAAGQRRTFRTEHAESDAGLWIIRNTDGHMDYYNADRRIYADFTRVWDPSTGKYTYGGESRSSTGPLSLIYANASALEWAGSLSAHASVRGDSALAVPEPETYALMLAGLGVVGLVARRRRGL